MKWFRQWWAGRKPAPPPSPPPAARAPVVPAAASPKVDPGANAALGLRRPLVGRQGQVSGFDLQLAPAAERRLAEQANPVIAAAHHVALLAAAGSVAQQDAVALVRIDAALLMREAVCAAVPPKAWLCVQGLADLPPAVSAELRGRGVRLGVPDGPPQAQPPVDFVLARGAPAGLETLLLSGQRWREAQPQVAMVAVELPHLDDVEEVLKAGFRLAGGQLGHSAQAWPRRSPGAAAHRICELINLLALDSGLAALSDAVRADATLTYRLLRYANSPSVGLREPAQTVERAVTVLGRVELGRWLAVLLLSAAQSRPASPALQERALARGRLLEALTRLQGRPDTGIGFTMGLLSGIEPLLQVPLAAALEPLRLPEDARLALLQRQGPGAPGLELLDALDAGDAPGVLQSLGPLGLEGESLASVSLLQDEAWAWAAAVNRPR